MQITINGDGNFSEKYMAATMQKILAYLDDAFPGFEWDGEVEE